MEAIYIFSLNRKYEEALEYHQKALVLSPKNPSTLSAMGYVHTLMENYTQAVDVFHKVTIIFAYSFCIISTHNYIK